MELDEHEQGERVQRWLRQNGSSLITGIALGLALVFGWQWWQGRGVQQKEQAATQYAALVSAIDGRDAAKAKALSSVITDKYADTAYFGLAVLRNAAFLHSSGKTGEAIKLLEANKGKIRQAEMAEIFALRLARLQLIDGKAADALKQVDGIAKPQFPGIAAELRGDIAAAQGRRDDARKAYELALSNLDQAAPTRNLVELKLIDAGGQPPAKPEA